MLDRRMTRDGRPAGRLSSIIAHNGGHYMTTQTNIVSLPRTTSPAKRTRAVNRQTKAIRRQTTVASAAGIVAATLTALSLSHLAHGIALMTSCPTWESWAMAIGIDCGFITLELLLVTSVTEAVRRKISKHAKPAIIGTLGGSALMNALAFAFQTTGYMVYPAAVLGMVIPALIYLITRAATTAYLSRA